MPNQKRHAPARTANGSATADQPPAPTAAETPATETASTAQSQPQPTQAPPAQGQVPPQQQQQRRDGLRITDLKDMSIQKLTQIAKDLSDNLTISYNTSEVVMGRLQQTTNAKERIYAQAISFFSTNDSVLTALKASFTGMIGLHESTQTLNEMKEGVSKSLESISEVGNKVQEEAVKAGYGPTVRADAVKKLLDSVVGFQERSQQIIEEMRKLSTQNSAEIRDAVEDGKRRIAKLVADGKALPL